MIYVGLGWVCCLLRNISLRLGRNAMGRDSISLLKNITVWNLVTYHCKKDADTVLIPIFGMGIFFTKQKCVSMHEICMNDSSQENVIRKTKSL